MNVNVLVLDFGYAPINQVPWQKAIAWVYEGQAETVDTVEGRLIGTVDGGVPMPSVVRLTKRVSRRAFKKHVRFNRRNVWIRDGGKCCYCDQEVTQHGMTYDHVIPRSAGGSTQWTNIVTACRSCNHRKGNRTPLEARMRLLRAPTIPGNLQNLDYQFHQVPENWKPWLGM